MPSASAVIVDTDVVSYLFKNDARGQAYRPHLTGRLLVVSLMTGAELDRWALEHNWGAARRARMERHLHNFAVYPFDRSLCPRWAKAADSARRSGRLDHRDRPRKRHPSRHNNAGHYAGVEGPPVIAEITQPE